MEKTMTKRFPTREEIRDMGEKARAFYEPLRPELEKTHWGEYITIHPGNGDYSISADHREAVDAMRAKYPGVLFHSIHIGYRAFGHFGGKGVSDGKRQ